MIEPLHVPSYWSSGMTANVSFDIVNRQNVLTLPSSAVKERNGNKFVMVMVNNRPEPKQITTGATDGKSIEITGGLNEGERVITSNGTGENRQNFPHNQRRFIPGMMH